MDFVTGLPRTSHDSDSVGVIMDRLTKSAHFILVQVSFSAERLARIYIHEIVLLHGVLLSYYLRSWFSVHISLLEDFSG